jgi:hypothetical protein
MDERQIARFLALGRVVIGAGLTALPGTVGSTWIGPVAHQPGAKVAIRALGVRDAAMGLGTHRALVEGDPVGPWLQAGVVSDAVDAAATLVAFRRIGARRAIPALALALGAAALGARIAGSVD